MIPSTRRLVQRRQRREREENEAGDQPNRSLDVPPVGRDDVDAGAQGHGSNMRGERHAPDPCAAHESFSGASLLHRSAGIIVAQAPSMRRSQWQQDMLTRLSENHGLRMSCHGDGRRAR